MKKDSIKKILKLDRSWPRIGLTEQKIWI